MCWQMKYKPINECHTNFASFNKFVFQMCFQYMILVCEIYELWLKEFCTIFIINSWDAKFVINKCDQ
jgi:hypothetical protein